jgi:hypothetical protein
MNQNSTELLDPEIREPIRQMMRQMPPSNFDDLPAAYAASSQQMAKMKKLVRLF